MLRQHEKLRDEISRIESSLHEVEDRQALLHRLGGLRADTSATADQPEAASPAEDSPDSAGLADRDGALRGPAIRRAAVEVLLRHPEAPEALHYRRWYELLREAGHEVAGKNAVAVFLTQLSRSPVVRRSTQAGVYELDRSAPARLRGELDALHRDLRALVGPAGPTADLGAIRARRAELTARIGQVEKALEEAEALITGQIKRVQLKVSAG
ncbi:MAG: hypothetical protein WKF96_01630 [Solirubrobacteraceae bacterium]